MVYKTRLAETTTTKWEKVDFKEGLWMRLFRNYSVNQIAGFGLLVPLFATFFSRFILGESLTFYNLMAGGFIVMGLLVSQTVPKTQIRIRLEALVNQKGKLEIKLCHFQKLSR